MALRPSFRLSVHNRAKCDIGWQGAAARRHCPMVIMTQQAEARGDANQRLWTNLMQILPTSKVPEEGM